MPHSGRGEFNLLSPVPPINEPRSFYFRLDSDSENRFWVYNYKATENLQIGHWHGVWDSWFYNQKFECSKCKEKLPKPVVFYLILNFGKAPGLDDDWLERLEKGE